MKAEDYFKVYKIENDEDKRFTDTFFLAARRWAEQLPDMVGNYDYGDTPPSEICCEELNHRSYVHSLDAVVL